MSDSGFPDSEARQQALPAGYRIGEYEIERILGEGGFGVTYLARHTVILKHVAIKEYLPVDFAVRSEGQTVRPRTEGTREHYEWGLGASSPRPRRSPNSIIRISSR